MLALRVLQAPSQEAGTHLRALVFEALLREQKLLEFLQNECGQQPVLRHLAKLLQEVEADEKAVFRAAAVNTVALTSLGLEERPIERSPMAHMEQRWAESYLRRYPHRRLRWTGLGAVVLRWRHGTGHTILTVSERQAKLLLALDDDSEVQWNETDEEVQLLLGPLELCDRRLLLRSHCHEAWLKSKSRLRQRDKGSGHAVRLNARLTWTCGSYLDCHGEQTRRR